MVLVPINFMQKLTDKEKFDLFMKPKFDKLAALRAYQHDIPVYIISTISIAIALMAVLIRIIEIETSIALVLAFFVVAFGIVFVIKILYYFYKERKNTINGIGDLSREINSKTKSFIGNGIFRDWWLDELK